MAAAFIARHPLKVFRNASHNYSMESFLACALVFALVLIVVSRFDTRLASVRVLRPLTWCGLLCYSMYLVHLPVVSLVSRLLYGNGTETMTTSMLLVTIAAGVAATVPVAGLFHVTVERRWMNAR